MEPTSIVIENSGDSRFQKIFASFGWAAFGLVCLALFTVLKLPEVRLKNYIQGQVSSVLAQKGITFTAEQASLSLGFGISYVMKDVTLTPPPPATAIKLNEIDVSPSLTSLIFGKLGGDLYVEQGSGTLKGTFSMSQSKTKSDFSVALKAKALDLGKTGALLMAAGILGSGQVSGTAEISGDLNAPNTWSGKTDIDLSKLVIDAQAIQGFNVPRISVSEGKIETKIDQGKIQFQNVKLGKPGSSDDIIATLTGTGMLGRQIEASTVSIKSRFTLSQNIMKSFVLLDALLGQFKQADGSYVYDYTGPLSMQSPMGAMGQ